MSRLDSLLQDKIPLYLPSLKKTIHIPKKVARIVFCFNKNGMATRDVTIENEAFNITIKNYESIINWLKKITTSNTQIHKEFINYTNKNIKLIVKFNNDENVSNTKKSVLEMCVQIPLECVKQFDTLFFRAIRTPFK